MRLIRPLLTVARASDSQRARHGFRLQNFAAWEHRSGRCIVNLRLSTLVQNRADASGRTAAFVQRPSENWLIRVDDGAGISRGHAVQSAQQFDNCRQWAASVRAQMGDRERGNFIRRIGGLQRDLALESAALALQVLAAPYTASHEFCCI